MDLILKQLSSTTEVAAPAPTPDSQSTPASEALAGRKYAPALGTRVEVLWQIDSVGQDGNMELQERWWGAVVQDCLPEVGGSGVIPEFAEERVHVLLYDAYGEFEEDTARVVFVANRGLVDMERTADDSKGLLDWRVEGEGMDEGREISMREVANEATAMVVEAGISENADLDELRKYPANVQIGVASGYRALADGVKQMLRELVASKPNGYVVTEADVQSIFQRIQETEKQLQQAGS